MLLIAGWTVAGLRQPDGYDGITDTISELAAVGATDRWIMNITLVAVGFCYVVTAAGLRPVPVAGRGMLAVGGLATIAVTAFPQPEVGPSDAHGVTASIACLSVALWPAGAVLLRRIRWIGPGLAGFAGRRPGGIAPLGYVEQPWPLRPLVVLAVTGLLLALAGWFVLELQSRGTWIGVSERIAAGAQALWPLVVVLAIRRAALRDRLPRPLQSELPQ
ncbi:DUF998 domain-containing protein [Micromonospora sonneratiae]